MKDKTPRRSDEGNEPSPFKNHFNVAFNGATSAFVVGSCVSKKQSNIFVLEMREKMKDEKMCQGSRI